MDFTFAIVTCIKQNKHEKTLNVEEKTQENALKQLTA